MSKIQTAVKKYQQNQVIGIVVFALLSVILANSTAASFQSPLNIALAGAVSPVYATSIFAGSLITYLVTGKVYLAAIHILGLMLVVVSRWIFFGKINSQQSAFITSVCMIFSSIVSGIAVGYDITITIVFLCISVLTGLGTFFIAELVRNFRCSRVFVLNGTSGCALAVVYIMLIMSMSSLNFAVLNIGRILGAFVILYAAKRYRYTGGSICGILTSCGVMLYSKDVGTATIFLGITGLVTGFFAEFSSLILAFFFISVNAVGQMLFGLDEAAFRMEADIIIGSMLFVFVPTLSLETIFVRTNEADEYITKLFLSRFDFMTDSLKAVRKNAENIAKMLNKKSNNMDVSTEVCEKVCSKCRNKLTCWENNYEQTNENFRKLGQKRCVGIASVSGYLENCINRQEIAEEFNVEIRKKFQQKFSEIKLKEMQDMLFDQMQTAEQIIISGCRSISEKFNYDNAITKQISTALERNGITFSSAIAYFTLQDKLVSEIYFENQHYTYNINEICDIISLELDKNMECYEPVHAGSGVKVIVSEESKYQVNCSIEKSNGLNVAEPSGDNCEYFHDGYGNIYLVISDGMGSGKQAAIESKMVINHFKRLIRAGIDHNAAIKMVNSIMVTKSGEENFATLDIAKINLEEGKLRLIKLGASSTLIKHGENLTMINSPSFPIGIISNTEPFEKELDFVEGDILIMLSDGVNESEYKHIKEIINFNRRNNINTLASEICKHAQENSEDDVSVIIANINLN